MLEVGLLENIQREDLNVIEEANAYKQMMETLDMTQSALSDRVGKTRTHIANIVRLLKLPKNVQQMVVDKKLMMSHVRPLITLNDPDEIQYYADEIVDKNLTVREVENMMRKDKEPSVRKPEVKKDPQLVDVEKNIEEKLSTKVRVKKNKIEINYEGVDDLNRILEKLNLLED